MKLTGILTAVITSGLTVGLGAIAPAQAAMFYAGTASTGKSVHVDMDSISRVSQRSVDFVYYLGGERIFAQANCHAGSWTTFPEGERHYPQSRATQRMVDFVCSRVRNVSTSVVPQTVRVIDPPSNVRATPNGRIVCTLPRTNIQVFESVGSWYRTHACGRSGYIHVSQIQF
ncbi:MAG: hypothetical protein HC866_04115 [Leptolyngbyaceae cyanobacterium RU_5_1]|nr:hypothetical protein [Leptolyngbyaceae cyanobacterium RU_5_1]